MSTRPPILLLAFAAAALLCACGGGGGGVVIGPLVGTCGGAYGACGGGGGALITVAGTIRYERLVYGPGGLGPATELKPARFVDVEVRSAGGDTCYGRGRTDADGDYALLVTPPDGSQIEVAVHSRTTSDPTRQITVHEGYPPGVDIHSLNNVFCAASAAFAAATGTHDLTVPYASGPSNRPSIGFGVLDVLVTCWDRAVAALGAPLPALQAYTQLGNNAGLYNPSYYNGSTSTIALLGGAAGLPDNSDTDYFDNAVIAHEFVHFLDDKIGFNWSRGGAHHGELLEPNFAWSEGSATGFGQLLLQSIWYTDSYKTTGAALFTINVENVTQFDNNGLGDEFSMAEILWDLGDDTTTVGDADGDGVNVALADLIAALASFDPDTDGPYIGLFLARVVALSPSVTSGAMSAFLAGAGGSENQQISFPPAGTDVFPNVIALGGMDTGTLDSTVGNPCRGLAASAWYHLTVPPGTNVTIDLTITPIAGSGDNLDLFLYRNSTVSFFPLASSANTGAAAEQISLQLGGGTYVIRVEASCTTGNRASYTLSVN